MPNLRDIEKQLDTPALRDNLTPLFCRTLRWGRPRGQPRTLAVGVPVSQSLRLVPVAQLGGLPVYRLDWPAERLPNVTQRRAVHRALTPTDQEHLLCYVTQDGRQAAFVWARPRPEGKLELRTLPYEVGSPARTTLEQLTELGFALDELVDGEPPVTLVADRLNRAFDVERVTGAFFAAYKQLFEALEKQVSIRGPEKRRLFAQRFFNRLMFVHFLERKGWLRFNGRRDYLRALWEDHQRERARDPQANFYLDRLYLLFFAGLNTSPEVHVPDDFLRGRIGEVPYLNGGLFEQQDGEGDVRLPDEAIGAVLEGLFYRFNFTVTESTPLDIEVAVDPEMLGRIFEELVTGRHETGSYYTPKPVVQFMCRQALQHYLRQALPEETAEDVRRFVEERDPADLDDPEAALAALKAVRVCDLACGSGAYLMGMLHELLELRACLFAHVSTGEKVYGHKLEIIQNNLYGVDIDPFAVNIARLRLWLSLMVDYEGETPLPLPNLDFKIAEGDSLTAPDPSGKTVDMFRQQQIGEYYQLKEAYLRETHYGRKRELRQRIEKQRAEIAAWAHPRGQVHGFDWAAEFAEVFAGTSGFDIVLTNPPYVRQELLGQEYKESLKPVYPAVFKGTADLYVYFYARAQQLLKTGGVGCFISSNKWLRAAYGEKLRQHLLDGQAFRLVVDFGELPVFATAATFPAIFLWQKEPRGGAATAWAVVKDLVACYEEGIAAHVGRIAQQVPAAQFGAGKARLATPEAADRRARMESSGPRLGEIVNGQIYRGITTGLNEAFVIDAATRDRLIAENPKTKEILRPLIAGDDVRRYELHYRELYLVWTYIGVPIRRYPAVLQHLKQYQEQAEARWDKGEQWWELRACDYYEVFDHPKIISSKMASEPRFVIDTHCHFLLNTAYCIPGADWYLLGMLNSTLLADYLKLVLVIFGDPDKGGRPEPRTENLLAFPIPDASAAERKAVAKLAEEAQRLHGERRQRVEAFLVDIGTSAAQLGSRNPLEQPWSLAPEDFLRRVKGGSLSAFTAAREETVALTAQIEKVECEIDERVAELYGIAASRAGSE